MADPAPRRRARRRRWWPRRALPRSRRALALGGLVAAVTVGLLLLGLDRARSGPQVPSFEPAATSTTTQRGPRLPPVITTTPASSPTTTATARRR